VEVASVAVVVVAVVVVAALATAIDAPNQAISHAIVPSQIHAAAPISKAAMTTTRLRMKKRMCVFNV